MLILILNSVRICSAAVLKNAYGLHPNSKSTSHCSLLESRVYLKCFKLNVVDLLFSRYKQTTSLTAFAFMWMYALFSFLQTQNCYILLTFQNSDTLYFISLHSTFCKALRIRDVIWEDRIIIENYLVPNKQAFSCVVPFLHSFWKSVCHALVVCLSHCIFQNGLWPHFAFFYCYPFLTRPLADMQTLSFPSLPQCSD